MISTILYDLIKIDTPPAELLIWYDMALIVVGFFLFLVYLTAWDVCLVWMKAWFKRRPVSLEWGKDKTWKFEVPDIPKKFPYMWKLSNNKPVEVRREAVGIAPHKIPMMLSTSEYTTAVSPTEINGKNFFVPNDWFWGVMFNDEVTRLKEPTGEELENYGKLLQNPEIRSKDQFYYDELEKQMNMWNSRQMWVEYPQHGLNPSEFVKYQTVNPDPMITEAYAEYAELEAREAAHSPFQMITQNLHILIPLLVMFAVAWIILQDHSMAMKAAGDVTNCQKELTRCVADCGSYTAEQIKAATEIMPTGGGVS